MAKIFNDNVICKGEVRADVLRTIDANNLGIVIRPNYIGFGMLADPAYLPDEYFMYAGYKIIHSENDGKPLLHIGRDYYGGTITGGISLYNTSYSGTYGVISMNDATTFNDIIQLIQFYTAGDTDNHTMLKTNELGVISEAIPGVDYLTPDNIPAGNFIQNQVTTPQTADFWITGEGRITKPGDVKRLELKSDKILFVPDGNPQNDYLFTYGMSYHNEGPNYGIFIGQVNGDVDANITPTLGITNTGPYSYGIVSVNGDFSSDTGTFAVCTIHNNFRVADGTEAEGKVLTSDADGIASWQEPTVKNTKDNSNLSFWVGSQAEWDALSPKPSGVAIIT